MTSQPDAGRPAVFLDRDGTIMEDVDYCSDPRDVRLIGGAANALGRMQAAGFKLIIITNQSGIGRGYFSEAQYHAVHDELLRQLRPVTMDGCYYCPDHPDAASPRRKPSPEMIFEAQREHRIDLARSWFIGDKAIDVECGRRAGVRTILVKTGKGETAPDADRVAENLDAAADIVVRACDE